MQFIRTKTKTKESTSGADEGQLLEQQNCFSRPKLAAAVL